MKVFVFIMGDWKKEGSVMKSFFVGVGGQAGDDEMFILCLFLSYTSKVVQSSLSIEIIVKALVLITGHLKKGGKCAEKFFWQ